MRGLRVRSRGLPTTRKVLLGSAFVDPAEEARFVAECRSVESRTLPTLQFWGPAFFLVDALVRSLADEGRSEVLTLVQTLLTALLMILCLVFPGRLVGSLDTLVCSWAVLLLVLVNASAEWRLGYVLGTPAVRSEARTVVMTCLIYAAVFMLAGVRSSRSWVVPVSGTLIYAAVSLPSDLCPEGQYGGLMTTLALGVLGFMMWTAAYWREVAYRDAWVGMLAMDLAEDATQAWRESRADDGAGKAASDPTTQVLFSAEADSEAGSEGTDLLRFDAERMVASLQNQGWVEPRETSDLPALATSNDVASAVGRLGGEEKGSTDSLVSALSNRFGPGHLLKSGSPKTIRAVGTWGEAARVRSQRGQSRTLISDGGLTRLDVRREFGLDALEARRSEEVAGRAEKALQESSAKIVGRRRLSDPNPISRYSSAADPNLPCHRISESTTAGSELACSSSTAGSPASALSEGALKLEQVASYFGNRADLGPADTGPGPERCFSPWETPWADSESAVAARVAVLASAGAESDDVPFLMSSDSKRSGRDHDSQGSDSLLTWIVRQVKEADVSNEVESLFSVISPNSSVASAASSGLISSGEGSITDYESVGTCDVQINTLDGIRPAFDVAELAVRVRETLQEMCRSESWEIPWGKLRNWTSRCTENDVLRFRRCKYGATPVAVTIFRNQGAQDDVGGQYTPGQRLQFQRTAAALFRARHPNIIQLLGVVTKAHYEGMCLVFEDCFCGTLRDWIISRSSWTPATGFFVAVQTARAVDYLHAIGCQHRAITPSNVAFLSQDRSKPLAKLTGFGLATLEGDGDDDVALEDADILPAYVAPEVFDGESSYGSDVYALGITMYESCVGRGSLLDEELLDGMKHMLGILPGQQLPEAAITSANLGKTLQWLRKQGYVPLSAEIDRTLPGVFSILRGCWLPRCSDRSTAQHVATRCNVALHAQNQRAARLEKVQSWSHQDFR